MVTNKEGPKLVSLLAFGGIRYVNVYNDVTSKNWKLRGQVQSTHT